MRGSGSGSRRAGAGAGAGQGCASERSATHAHRERSAVAAQGRAQASAYEVDADGRDVALGIRVVSKAQQQAGLADTRVADQHELEHVVILLRCGGRHRARSVGKERRRAETRARATAALAGHVMGTQGWVNPLWILTRARRGERCAPAPSECDGAVCVTVACEHAGQGRRQRRCSVELGVCVLEWH
jgi:hypothetical protein